MTFYNLVQLVLQNTTINQWVVRTSALKAIVKEFNNRNFVLQMQVFTFVLTIIT